MRVLLLFDQIQMGYGGKERADTPLGLEKGGVGLTEALQNIAAIISQPENRNSPLIYK